MRAWLGDRLPGYKSQLDHTLLRFWLSYSTSPKLSLRVGTMEMVVLSGEFIVRAGDEGQRRL